jgi:hypothetical protein
VIVNAVTGITPNIFNSSLLEASVLMLLKRYFENAMDAAAMGAEKPTIRETHPERNPNGLPMLSLKKTYSPPALGILRQFSVTERACKGEYTAC